MGATGSSNAASVDDLLDATAAAMVPATWQSAELLVGVSTTGSECSIMFVFAMDVRK